MRRVIIVPCPQQQQFNPGFIKKLIKSTEFIPLSHLASTLLAPGVGTQLWVTVAEGWGHRCVTQRVLGSAPSEL